MFLCGMTSTSLFICIYGDTDIAPCHSWQLLLAFRIELNPRHSILNLLQAWVKLVPSRSSITDTGEPGSTQSQGSPMTLSHPLPWGYSSLPQGLCTGHSVTSARSLEHCPALTLLVALIPLKHTVPVSFSPQPHPVRALGQW